MVYIPTSVTFESADYTVKGIVYSAFQGCENLQSAALPETLVNISGNAFMDCKRLKEVKFSQSLATIGDSIFMGCESLQSAFLYGSAIAIHRYYACMERI